MSGRVVPSLSWNGRRNTVTTFLFLGRQGSADDVLSPGFSRSRVTDVLSLVPGLGSVRLSFFSEERT